MTVTIAIVGAGPRALWALEELTVMSRERNLALDVTVFDPRDPAVGSAYATDQPTHRLVNVTSSAIRTGAGTLDDYRGEGAELDPFPPRALVGEFLTHSWREMLRKLPEQMTVTHERRRITDLAELSGFNEILLATGHQQAELPEGMLDVYDGDLSVIAPGESVAIRGAALTFIDVVLALTLGRGGRFVDQTYVPSGEEPGSITAYTRTGAAIQVKPSPLTDEERAQLEPFREQIRGGAEIREVLCAASSALAGQPVTLADAEPDTDVAGGWRASIAEDRRPPQALGLAWRELYPQIVERVSFGREDLDELPRLLEPLAFGPPPAQIRRMLALHDTGILRVAGERPEAQHTINAVLAPAGIGPGSLEAQLGEGALQTDEAGMVSDNIASVGRASEPYILGHDTLSRTMHGVIPAWARRIGAVYGPKQVHGVPPLTGRLESWMSEPDARGLIDTYSSPVNVLNSAPVTRNIDELVAAGERAGVDVRIHFARKANKALTFVDAVNAAGHGVDVASYRELSQVIDTGVPGERIIVSAAIKTDEFLELALAHGATVSVDSVGELERLQALTRGRQALIAPRIAPDPAKLPPTRFGERSAVWAEALNHAWEGITVRGLHAHLHGYAVADRRTALGEALWLVDKLRQAGHAPEFVDLGGGVPMSYLDNAGQWENFQETRRAMVAGDHPPFTWKAHPLDTVYPFHQAPVRGDWLAELLASDEGQGLKERGLRLHLEPGRSLLDGCGIIYAEVAFVKKRSDGLPLVGLAMNRTQLRTTSDDYLVDPLHLPAGPAEGEELEAYLVGAYCIEDELIMRRRIRFPNGVKVGDIVAFPNTAGYFMHILESASHQIPLALNVARNADGGFELDRIDS
ncbi:FAD/NAD(P)-binding protein [Corynebacterium doosanense]|uniref:Diaminopimelate decarboxylase n=1 Tax=Corynebacterium doosanense CAU 212 = DSM 45436 TaxID=558173 RepID=A0A097IFM9_9CORY|nr:FAD/NAD(P)-binding protein [Corynebacterium doosanense]AIT60938.1 diaminopimelate decarboxylase [Corynebacterium doosanense CAU 212 = DSM 45436]